MVREGEALGERRAKPWENGEGGRSLGKGRGSEEKEIPGQSQSQRRGLSGRKGESEKGCLEGEYALWLLSSLDSVCKGKHARTASGT
eukprot:3423515-Pleurochrysis_carterae.AAC.1